MTLIMKVRKNKSSEQKCVTIPKDEDIQAGDYVRIIKVKEDDI